MNVALIQARLSSTRLPGKCLKKINGIPMTSYVVEAARKSKLVDFVGIVCPYEDLEHFKEIYGNICFGGSKDDVLNRYCQAIEAIEAIEPIKVIKNVVRLTSDCPLLMYYSYLIDRTIKMHNKLNLGYTNNRNKKGYPSGLDVEVINKYVLMELDYELEKDDPDREHVTLSIRKRSNEYKVGYLNRNLNIQKDEINEKWSIDTQEDLDKVSKIISLLNLGV